MAATDHGVSRVSDCLAVNRRPPLPPDYELDDYWMKNIVLKDEKEAEDEFYSALGRFSTNNNKFMNHPPPPYVAARIAAAPRYNPFSSLLAKSKQQPHDFTFSTDSKPERSTSSGYDCNSLFGLHKKEDEKKQGMNVNVGVTNHKRKRINSTFNDSDYYYYFPKESAADQVKKPRLILVIKRQKIRQSCNLPVEHATAAPATPPPPHRIQDQQQHQQQIADVHSALKSVSPKSTISAANQVAVLPDRELIINNLLTAKMGICGSLMLVMTKTLTRTDLVRAQNRLSIPHGQVQNDFLKLEEKEFLGREQKGLGCSTIEVELLILDQHHLQQPHLEEIKVHSINFANWKTNSMYVLKTSWISLVQQYQLQEGTSVQLWAFRSEHSKLCFALLRN